MVMWSSAFAACLCLFLPATEANFLPTPSVRWTYDLSDTSSGTTTSRRLGRGNNVVASQDGSRVFSTASDGSLHIVYTSALDFSSVFEPEVLVDTVTSCQSGVTLVEIETDTSDDAKVEYAVYAVTDESTAQETTSRLLAVNVDGTLRWSAVLEGSVVGKPIVGAAQNTFYVVHNIPGASAEAADVGRISVIVVDSQGGPLVAATLPETAANAPFGPATGKTIQEQNGPGQNGSEIDIIVFGENIDDGLSQEGALYMLIPSSENEALGGRGNEAYDLRLIFDFARSTVARPAVSADGTAVYLASQESTLTGWNGRRGVSGVIDGTEEGIFPQFLARPARALRNGLLPFPSAPIMSADEGFLYLAGASASVLCVSTADGSDVWSFVTDGLHAAEPVLSEIEGEDPVLYTIETLTGLVRQFDATTGTVNWDLDCSVTETCESSVEADFGSSPNGNVIYYGNAAGKIVALQVATFETTAPTQFPSTAPSAVPSTSPSVTGQPTREPIGFPTSSPSNFPSGGPSKAVQNPTGQNGPTGGESPTGQNGPTGGESPTRSPVRDDSSSTNSGLGNNDDTSSNDLPLILGVVCGGAVFLIALAYMFLRCCRNSPGAAPAKKGDEEEAASKDTQSPEEYDEACRREEEEIQRLIAMGTPATPKIFPMSRKRSKSATKKNLTPATLGSITESPSNFIETSPSDFIEAYNNPSSPSFASGGELATDDGKVDDEEKGGEQGFEIALQDRMEFKKSQIPVKNLIRDFTEAEKNALAVTAAASAAALLATAQSNDRDMAIKVDEEETGEEEDEETDEEEEGETDEEEEEEEESENTVDGEDPSIGHGDAVEEEEARPVSPSPYIDPQYRPVSPTPSDVLSVDDSLFIEGNNTVASASVGGDILAGGKAKQMYKAQVSPQSNLDGDMDMSVGEPGPLSPGSQKQKNRLQERAYGTSSRVKPAVYSGVSVRPRRQSSEFSRGREPPESERTRPKAEDLSSDRAARPRAEVIPSTGESNVKNQIERFSSGEDQVSPREGGRKKVIKDDDMEPTSDAWSGFMNELSRAEEQFFNPPTAETSSDPR